MLSYWVVEHLHNIGKSVFDDCAINHMKINVKQYLSVKSLSRDIFTTVL